MAHFWVQMPDVDADDFWQAMTTISADEAAEEYAEAKDNSSGGELFREEGDCRTVFVKERGSEDVMKFVVGAHYSKSYLADLETSP